jgi:hypothetical protein
LKIAIMQPYFFPYLGYFQLIQAVDHFIFYDDVQFIKQGWIHRNRILLQGQPHFLTIPLKHFHFEAPIRSVEIAQSNGTPWQTKMIKMLQQAYSKAPFFHDVFPWVSELILSDPSSISELSKNSILETCRYLNIKKKRFSTSSQDFMATLLHGEARVIDLCQQAKGTTYINLSGGVDLYNPESFDKANLTLQFIRMNPLEYPQTLGQNRSNTPSTSPPFVPNLSMIDVMMFNPPEAILTQLENYQCL